VCARKSRKAGKAERETDGTRTIARNRKARHRFHILDTFEAGLALTGNEVKSLRAGGVSLDESYARVRDTELFLVDCHVAPYEKTGFDRPDPTRPRKLLLRKAEIRRLRSKVVERGLTLVPLRVYFKGPWAKVELALARGKGHADKREDVKRRTQEREMARVLRGRQKRGGERRR
jgi:SsrA-binding protein